MEIAVSLFVGIGFGTIISSIISAYYYNRKIIFETKLNKYSDLIQAYQDAVIHKSSEASRQNYVSFQKKVEIIGSKEVVDLSKKMYDLSLEKSSITIRDSLVLAMRNDLLKYY